MGKIIRTYSLRLSFIPFLACLAFLNPNFINFFVFDICLLFIF